MGVASYFSLTYRAQFTVFTYRALFTGFRWLPKKEIRPLVAMPPKAASARWCPKRRKAPDARETAAADECEHGIELSELVGDHLRLKGAWEQLHGRGRPGGCADMDNRYEKEQLARILWAGNYSKYAESLRDENPRLVELLKAVTMNSSTPTDREAFILNKQRQLDGILACIVRAQSQKRMPVLSAAQGVLAKINNVTREFHDHLSFFFKGASPSEKGRRFL